MIRMHLLCGTFTFYVTKTIVYYLLYFTACAELVILSFLRRKKYIRAKCIQLLKGGLDGFFTITHAPDYIYFFLQQINPTSL